MALKKLISASAAMALVFSPTVAAAAKAAPASQQVAPAAESIDEGSELRRTGFIIPLAGIALIVLIILLVTKKKDKEGVTP